jgi:hypothetical protein
VLVTCSGPDGDLIERHLAFGVLLAVIFPELLELEIPRPDDLSEMRSKLFEARGAVFGVILDAAHVLVGLAIVSMTSDVTADVTRRKTVTEMSRVLVDLLISITATIVVVVMTTSTTFLSAFIAVATSTWGWIVAMLPTWIL